MGPGKARARNKRQPTPKRRWFLRLGYITLVGGRCRRILQNRLGLDQVKGIPNFYKVAIRSEPLYETIDLVDNIVSINRIPVVLHQRPRHIVPLEWRSHSWADSIRLCRTIVIDGEAIDDEDDYIESEPGFDIYGNRVGPKGKPGDRNRRRLRRYRRLRKSRTGGTFSAIRAMMLGRFPP